MSVKSLVVLVHLDNKHKLSLKERKKTIRIKIFVAGVNGNVNFALNCQIERSNSLEFEYLNNQFECILGKLNAALESVLLDNF